MAPARIHRIFFKDHISGLNLQLFSDIMSFTKFITWERKFPDIPWSYELHSSKVSNTKDKSLVISELNMDIITLIRDLSYGRTSTTLYTDINEPEMCNEHDGIRGCFLRSKNTYNTKV